MDRKDAIKRLREGIDAYELMDILEDIRDDYDLEQKQLDSSAELVNAN
jgi:hypothetical protein